MNMFLFCWDKFFFLVSSAIVSYGKNIFSIVRKHGKEITT